MRFHKICYRLNDPRWSFAPISGAGAAIHGGRFNPAGVEALYLSLSIAGAFVEISQGFAEKFKPCTMVCYDVDCEDIADLRTPASRKKHGVALDDMACAWFALKAGNRKPPSWRVAERLMTAGFAGLLTPSFAHGADPARHRNLVLWKWGDKPPHQVLAWDPDDRLPRDRHS